MKRLEGRLPVTVREGENFCDLGHSDLTVLTQVLVREEDN